MLVEPVPDDAFGHRLRTVVAAGQGSVLTPAGLEEWLTTRLSRAEQPREIVIVAEPPRTATGRPVRDGSASAHRPAAPSS